MNRTAAAMSYGIRKGLEDIAQELKGIQNILGSMWHSRYSRTGETDVMSPTPLPMSISQQKNVEDDWVSDQTIRNWIAIGRKNPAKGWVEGIHYVNVSPDVNRKAVLRIPWNQLIHSLPKT
jgi:hypothetical protein